LEVLGLAPPREGAESIYNQVQDAALAPQKMLEALVRPRRDTPNDQQNHEHHHGRDGHKHHHGSQPEPGSYIV